MKTRAMPSHFSLSDSTGLKPARLFCPWGFSRREYWSGLLWPPPGDLPNPGIEAMSLTSNLLWQAGSLPLMPPNSGNLNKSNISQYAFLTRVTYNNLMDYMYMGSEK